MTWQSILKTQNRALFLIIKKKKNIDLFLFLHENVVGTHQKFLAEELLMSTHNIEMWRRNKKSIYLIDLLYRAMHSDCVFEDRALYFIVVTTFGDRSK